MIVRALDLNGDWIFGKSLNDYKSNVDAVSQNVQTRVSSFLSNCFFSLNDGIDWFNLLGGKNLVALNLAVSAAILNTESITGILQLSLNLNDITRGITIKWAANSSFGPVGSNFQFSIPI